MEDRGGIWMLEGEGCTFFRNPKNLGMLLGFGYCDLDGDWANCQGKKRFCEKPDSLIKYLYAKWERGKTVRRRIY